MTSFQTNDLGINPETNDHNYRDNTIDVTIEKYNFHEPVFVYPTDELRVFLSKVVWFFTKISILNSIYYRHNNWAHPYICTMERDFPT